MTTDNEAQLGAELFGAALDNDQDRVDALLLELLTRPDGRQVRARLAAAWIDATMESLGIQPGTDLNISVLTPSKLEPGEQVPADVHWSAQAFAARVAADETKWGVATLTLGVADTGKARDYLHRLLDMLAITMRLRAAGIVVEPGETVAKPVAPAWAARAASSPENAALN